jgi:hypothetical protein
MWCFCIGYSDTGKLWEAFNSLHQHVGGHI